MAYFLLVALIVITIGRGYYTEGFYPALFATGSVSIERFLSTRAAWWRAAVTASVLVTGAALAPLALPVFSPAGVHASTKERSA